MFFYRLIVLGASLLLSTSSFAQVLDYMDVHLTITEKVAEKRQPLSNTKLQISDYGEVSTNPSGKFTFPYAVRKNVDPGISISIISPEHKMLKPLDGFIEIDTTNEEMYIELFVVNMAEESEAFKKRINELDGRIANLKRKNELTQRQLNAIQSQLVDTIMHYENVKQELESKISNYEDLTEEQRQEIDAQRSQIDALEGQVSQLTQDLEAALEEQYLRKNQYFKDISANLRGYLRKAKDLKDHLPFISTYFSARSFANYERDIKGYNEQYEKFDNNKLDYLEGIKHYWENDRLLKKTEDLFDYLDKGIHYNQIFKTTMDVMAEVGKQKPKKAQKIATLAHEDLTINLDQFEKDINRLLSDLRKYQ